MPMKPTGPRAKRAGLILLLALLSMTPQGRAQEGGESLLVKAAQILPVEGRALVKGGLLIKAGRIASLGSGLKAPPGTKTLSFPKGVICPGLVDAATYVGIYRERDETAGALLPDLLVEDAFNPFDPTLKSVLKAGITTLQVMPGDRDIVGGRTAVVSVQWDGRVFFLRSPAAMKLSLKERRWPRNRKPTSALGALNLIQSRRHTSKALEALCAGQERAFIAVGSREEVLLACRLKSLCGIRGVLLGGPELRPHLARVARELEGVVLAPLLPSLSNHERQVAALLERSGVPLAFMSGAPAYPCSMLRLSAMTAVLGGLSREAALKALTLTAARLLGVGDQVGSLLPGKQGDLVVFSRHPLDPRARVLLVVQDGHIAFQAPGRKGS